MVSKEKRFKAMRDRLYVGGGGMGVEDAAHDRWTDRVR